MFQIEIITVYPVVRCENIIKTFFSRATAEKLANKLNIKYETKIETKEYSEEITPKNDFGKGLIGNFYDVGECKIPANEFDDEDYEENFGERILVDFGFANKDFELGEVRETLVDY